MKRLFIIGNGFDLSHNLPTSYYNNFRPIAESNEPFCGFWDLYQTQDDDVWADFENNLGIPDFNSLEEIFVGYEPDYFSDHESDRDSIITQSDISGNLSKSLYEFAEKAEESILEKEPKECFINLFVSSDYFITFNYTHTLEKLYNIENSHVLHVHGEVGNDNLILGYPSGNFRPEKYRYDYTHTSRGPFAEVEINKFINGIEDYYIQTAYKNLLDKCESFYKKFQKKKIDGFIYDKAFEEIIVIGHSCKIDFDYFNYLNSIFQNIHWVFNPHSEDDEYNIKLLI